MKILLLKLKDVIIFLWEIFHDTTNLLFGGIISFAFLIVGNFYKFPEYVYFVLFAILFVFAVFRKYYLVKNELLQLKNRLPRYAIKPYAIRITGKFESDLLHQYLQSERKNDEKPTNKSSEASIEISRIIEGYKDFLPKPPTDSEVREFKNKVDKYNVFFQSGVYAVCFVFENIGNQSDERIEIKMSLSDCGKITNLPTVPDEEDIKPKQRLLMSGRSALLNQLYETPILKLYIDGELDVTGSHSAKFFVKDTLQANNHKILPNEDMPVFINCSAKELRIDFDIYSKELPERQQIKLILDLEKVETIDISKISIWQKSLLNKNLEKHNEA
jgi:hypothetical protein